MPDFTYAGFFKVPTLAGISGRQFTFNSSQFPFAYRPQTKTLVLRGHPQFHDFAEITIPTNLTGTAKASVVGNWFEPTLGRIAQLSAQYGNNVFHRNCFIDNNDVMHGVVNLYYNVAGAVFPTYYTYNFQSQQATDFVKTINIPIKTSGYICELSTELKEFYGKQFGMAETIPQGTATTNNGPALYVTDPDMKEIPVITWTKEKPYKYGSIKRAWDGACRVDGMVDLPDALVWIGRLPTNDALVWYDHDHTYVSPGIVIKDGVTYTDPCTKSKGYHASNWNAVLFSIDHADLKNNNFGAIKETILSEIKSPCRYVSCTVDHVDGRLFVIENGGDYPRPLIHIYTFTSESQMQEQINILNQMIITLQQTITALQTAQTENEANVANLNNQLVAAQTEKLTLSDKLVRIFNIINE